MGPVVLLAGTVRWQCWAACTVKSNTGHTAHAAEWWRRAWVVEDSQNCEGSKGASVLRVVPPAYTQSELMLVGTSSGPSSLSSGSKNLGSSPVSLVDSIPEYVLHSSS